MWVDWVRKIMRFTHRNQRVTLYGLQQSQPSCSIISPHQLHRLVRQEAITHYLQVRCDRAVASTVPSYWAINTIEVPEQQELPPPVHELLQQYSDIFQEPHELPPQRSFDHRIELLLGATPISVRPYRYSPTQKDEIEKQLAQMLIDGIITESSSPYASSVLLVHKKDGSWRFCIDYRHLNALMVKNRHPMPIVEELIDELARAKWFSKLDFRAGYHQIRIAPEDTHKTAFKTHEGLYEFLVMLFGLTNVPAAFQSIMNIIFRALLRKGVLVFMDDILIYS